MSRLIERKPWQLGDCVSFDYYGDRLFGKIVKACYNPTYFHVAVEGKCYEVDLWEDKMKMEGDTEEWKWY